MVSVAGFAAVAERTGVLAAFGPSVVIVAESPLCIVGSTGGKRAPIRIMIPTSTNRTARFGLPGKVKLGITFSPIEGKIAGRFPTEIDVVREPGESCEFPLG